MMASIVRPTMLRQSCLKAVSKRAFSTKPTSTFPAINKPAVSVLSKQVARNAFAKDALPSAVRVAAFHASGRRPILPPLPRKFPNYIPLWTDHELICNAEVIDGTGMQKYFSHLDSN